jgi:hypothetical protein
VPNKSIRDLETTNFMTGKPKAVDSVRREDHSSTPNPEDQDRGKGAVEDDNEGQNHDGGNTSLDGQLGHRNKDGILKDADFNLPG